ncbi:MAG: hypothetical protein WC570_04630 [Patescibacteria group bacterium]
MSPKERQKMLIDVFAPQKNEKVLILVDVPRESIPDNQKWSERRQMAHEWEEAFHNISQENDLNLTVDRLEFPSVGRSNYLLPEDIIETAKQYHLVLSMSEYSYSVPLKAIIQSPDNISRIASMPQIEKRMEETAISADYAKVKLYATTLKQLLDQSIGAQITFSTNDQLYLDLRWRQIAIADDGDYTTTGSFGNFPAGEGFMTPYEGTESEKAQYGPSQTKGVMPFNFDGQIVKFIIEANQIVKIEGDEPKASELNQYFTADPTRRNIAELGLGCNPQAEITGNILEDEKAGLHIAYGTSSHFGGQVTSDTHHDLVFASGCPIEGTTVDLIQPDGSQIRVIDHSQMQYVLLEKMTTK